MIVLLGATSQIGYFLLKRMYQRHLSVMAVSRRAPPAWGIMPNTCWMQHDLDETPMPSDAGSLIAVGALRHVVDAVRVMPRLTHVVAVSSSSVTTKQGSRVSAEQRIVAELSQAETALQAICAERQIVLTLLRPTLVYGCGLDRNLTRIAEWLRRRSWLPIAYPARGQRQPVHADDLAGVCVNCLELGSEAEGCFELAGGSRLSYRQMVEAVAESLSLPLRLIGLPAWLLAPALDCAAYLAPFRGLNGAMVRRQNTDLLVDDTAAREQLQWHPRPFKPSASCFSPPR